MATGRARAVRTVGRYQLVHELAQSYLGPLWAVRVESGDSGAGLAMLRLVSLARLDADTRVRLLEAAWQAMEVRDDRVGSVTDVVASDGELGVVSDYVEGVTLRALSSFASVRRKPAAAPVAIRIALDLLAAVAALHRATAELGEEAVPLYGGLSADSVLVGADGRTFVLDVAVASAASAIESLGGNPERSAYAAPEQLGTPPRADARTDVFATGVLAWELLASRRLFVGSDKSVAQKVLSSKIPRPDELRRKGDPEVPAPLVAAIMKALDRNPDARFQSAEEFASALTATSIEPAAPAIVAEYVGTVAEGALSRAREALRHASSGPRTVMPARSDSRPKMPAATAGKPPLPARAEPRPAAPPHPAAKPALPAHTELRPPLPARAEPKPAIRPRQPTMIGIPAPAVHPHSEAAEKPVAPTPPAPQPTEPRESAPESIPASSVGGEPRAEMESLVGEEPTAQYTSRDLLRQVEAMGRSSRLPGGTPSTLPAPVSSDFPEPPTAPRPEPEPSPPPPPDGGWLDDPASLPPPPLVDREATTPDDPAETALVAERAPLAPRSDEASPAGVETPSFAEPAAPRAELLAAFPKPTVTHSNPPPGVTARAVATSTPPPPTAPTAYLPSQIPPPLFHDPRARAGASRRGAPAADSGAGAPALTRGTLIGILVSFGLVASSAAVAIIVLRSRDVPSAISAPTSVAEPGGPIPKTADEAPPAAVPSTAPSASPSAEEPSAEAPSAAPPAARAPAPPPRALPQAPRAAPQKRAAPKKKGRYVPDDI